MIKNQIDYIANYNPYSVTQDPNYYKKFKDGICKLLFRMQEVYNEFPFDFCFCDFDTECYLDDFDNYVFDIHPSENNTYHLEISNWMHWDGQRRTDEYDIPDYILTPTWKEEILNIQTKGRVKQIKREIEDIKKTIKNGPMLIEKLTKEMNELENKINEYNKNHNTTSN